MKFLNKFINLDSINDYYYSDSYSRHFIGVTTDKKHVEYGAHALIDFDDEYVKGKITNNFGRNNKLTKISASNVHNEQTDGLFYRDLFFH